MLIRMLANGDATIAGMPTALFEGQEYDVPDEQAKQLISAGTAERAGRSSEPSEKAVHAPPEDKALKTPRRRSSK